MTAALGYIAAGLIVLIAILATADAGIRFAARRGERITRELGPGAETAIADYLAGEGGLPGARSVAVSAAERTVLLQVAVEALGDLQGSERDHVADLVDRLGFVADALSRLRSRRRAVRRRAAETLAMIGTPSALAALRPALADRDVLVRCTAARLLAEAADDEAAAAVVAVADQDAVRAPGAVAAVVLALGMSRPAAIGSMLRPGVGAELKTLAIAVTGALRLSSHGPALQACLAQDDAIAAAAAHGLGRIGETMAVPALIALARDEGRPPTARAAAASALGSIGDVTAVPALGTLLSADDWSLRTAAAQGLTELGEEGTVALRLAAWSARPEVREPARAALLP